MRLLKVAERENQVSWKHPAAGSCLVPGMLMIPLPSIISLPASQAGPFQLMGLFLLHGKSNKPPVLLSCPLPGVQLIPGIVVPVVASIPLSPHPPPPSPPSSLYSSRTVCQEGKLLPAPDPVHTLECKGVGNTFGQVLFNLS